MDFPMETIMLDAPDIREVEAARIVNDAMPAPVSGPRCRGCGKNAKTVLPTAIWFVVDSAAYCYDCCVERFTDESGDESIDPRIEAS